MAKQNKPKYKYGDVLRTIAGTAFIIKGVTPCIHCGYHYILEGHPQGHSQSYKRMEDPRYIIPPTPAGKVLFGHN